MHVANQSTLSQFTQCRLIKKCYSKVCLLPDHVTKGVVFFVDSENRSIWNFLIKLLNDPEIEIKDRGLVSIGKVNSAGAWVERKELKYKVGFQRNNRNGIEFMN